MTPLVKRLSIALLISGGINLFLIGFGVSQWLSHRGQSRMEAEPRVGPPSRLFHAEAVFGADADPKFRRFLGKHREQLRPQRRALRRARRKVDEALTAKVFEREELERALAELRKQTGSTQVSLHAALVDLASQLTYEERRRLARANRPNKRRGVRKRRRAPARPEPQGPKPERPASSAEPAKPASH